MGQVGLHGPWRDSQLEADQTIGASAEEKSDDDVLCSGKAFPAVGGPRPGSLCATQARHGANDLRRSWLQVDPEVSEAAVRRILGTDAAVRVEKARWPLSSVDWQTVGRTMSRRHTAPDEYCAGAVWTFADETVAGIARTLPRTLTRCPSNTAPRPLNVYQLSVRSRQACCDPRSRQRQSLGTSRRKGNASPNHLIFKAQIL